MRILVHEFVSGGGCASHRIPASLLREGLAMRTALVTDLAAIGCHEVVTTTDLRFNRAIPSDVEVIPLPPGDTRTLDSLLASSDAVWLVAPETDRCLERLAARVERFGKTLLGPGAAAIRRASDKTRLPRRLALAGLQHPKTTTISPDVDVRLAARQCGYPLVIKPGRGAGSQGVCLVNSARELRRALDAVHRTHGTGPVAGRIRTVHREVVMQRYVPGTPASVSLLADGRRAVALAVNAQQMSTSHGFSYRGGRTPLDHPFAPAAMDAAVRACAALPGLRGYIGVDVVLTDAGAVVIEVNPRLTTAYLGVRAALDENVAALALSACDGRLPAQPIPRRSVRFTAAGLVDAA